MLECTACVTPRSVSSGPLSMGDLSQTASTCIASWVRTFTVAATFHACSTAPPASRVKAHTPAVRVAVVGTAGSAAGESLASQAACPSSHAPLPASRDRRRPASGRHRFTVTGPSGTAAAGTAPRPGGPEPRQALRRGNSSAGCSAGGPLRSTAGGRVSLVLLSCPRRGGRGARGTQSRSRAGCVALTKRRPCCRCSFPPWHGILRVCDLRSITRSTDTDASHAAPTSARMRRQALRMGCLEGTASEFSHLCDSLPSAAEISRES